jgi:hypothetical protein
LGLAVCAVCTADSGLELTVLTLCAAVCLFLS